MPLKPKVFDTLLVLVENRGRVLDKDELLNRVWPDAIVEESNLSQNVYLLRKVLGTEGNGEVYIETMPKRGYRFVASVNKVADAGPELILAEAAQTHEAEPTVQEKRLSETSQKRQISQWKASLVTLTMCLVGVGIILALPYFWTGIKSKPVARTPVRSIAVLPFKPLSSDRSDEELGFWMADTLITRLSSVIVTRPTSAVRKFTSPSQDPVAAGRELKVDAVLESSIQRADDRIRVTLRLLSVSDGLTLWAGHVDQQFNDVFGVQDRISEQVARALVPELTGDQKNLLAKHYTQNADAYRFYVNGRYHWNKSTVEDWKKAIEYFNQAIEKDPNYALAFAGLADAYMSIVADSLVTKTDAIPKAKQAATKALQLDDTLAEAHVSMGRIKAYYDWDWAGAENEFKRAIELDHNSSIAHREYANYLTYVGRSEEAVTEALKGRELDPLSQLANFNVAWALIFARRFDEAIAESRKVAATFPTAHYWIGVAYLGKGMNPEAIAEFEKTLSVLKDHHSARSYLGYAYAISGRRRQAEAILAELKQLPGQQLISPYHIALIYAGLGDKDQAFQLLEQAYREHSRPLGALKAAPVWDNFRSDPRFKDLLHRIGLE